MTTVGRTGRLVGPPGRVKRVRVAVRSKVDGTLVWVSVPVSALTKAQRAALRSEGRLPVAAR